jgi:hypothetical protein
MRASIPFLNAKFIRATFTLAQPSPSSGGRFINKYGTTPIAVPIAKQPFIPFQPVQLNNPQ